jgi:hypothetical protein
MTTDDPQHSVQEVKIEGATVKVVCTCGWESETWPTEAEARQEHEIHQERP